MLACAGARVAAPARCGLGGATALAAAAGAGSALAVGAAATGGGGSGSGDQLGAGAARAAAACSTASAVARLRRVSGGRSEGAAPYRRWGRTIVWGVWGGGSGGSVRVTESCAFRSFRPHLACRASAHVSAAPRRHNRTTIWAIGHVSALFPEARCSRGQHCSDKGTLLATSRLSEFTHRGYHTLSGGLHSTCTPRTRLAALDGTASLGSIEMSGTLNALTSSP